jgi:hypothetical protein
VSAVTESSVCFVLKPKNASRMDPVSAVTPGAVRVHEYESPPRRLESTMESLVSTPG